MMKGHTKIILTNVETGEQVVHEDDNLITKAIDKIININMAMNLAPNDRLLPMATNALGGIMLFDGELTESEDNIHFPTEAHLVGYASTNTNTSDKFRGSWNSVESGKTESGYVSVWDFGTSQANGTIRAVARTSVHAGQNPLFYYLSPTRGRTSCGAPATDTGWVPIRYDGTYLYMLKGNSNTHQMRLARVKIPMLQFGVADYSDVARTYEVIASWDTLVTTYSWWYYQDHHDVANEQYVYADDPNMYEDGGDGKLYCVFYGPTKQYTEYPYDITYFTINYGDESYDKSETIRLNSGTSYWTDYSTYNMYYTGHYRGHVNKGVLYRISNNRKVIYMIPLDNVASYSAVRILSDDTSDFVEDLCRVKPHNGGIYFEVYHYTTSSYNRQDGILYPDGVYVLPGSYTSNNDHGDSAYTESRTVDDDLTVFGYYGDVYVYRGWAANYLGTINNLASPIEKTAAQTMKIIYTLTDVEG